MKFIKTYWPGLEGLEKAEYYSRLKNQPLYLFGLSASLLLQDHTTELYTDPEGAEIVRTLGIPFPTIHTIERPSPRWKAFNDLHVLSLQDSPAVLLEDSILPMGPIDITVAPGSATALGVDLNSIRLVKSIIKIQRMVQAAPIPHFYDGHWTEKAAYIDTSLLAMAGEDLHIIRDYLPIVAAFLQEHEQTLTSIDHDLVEHFIRRYWLYSYLSARGLGFAFYWNDPLQIVSRHTEAFFAAPWNIIQNILLIRENHLSDPQFVIHLIQFLDEYFTGLAQTIRRFEPPSTDRSEVSKYPRLRQAYRNACPHPSAHNKTPTLRQIRATLASPANNDLTERNRLFLTDLFEYETVLNKLIRLYDRQRDDIRRQQKSAFTSLLSYERTRHHGGQDIQITLNPFAYLHESRWKWSTRWIDGVGTQKIASLKVLYNAAVEPAYYITAFIPDPEGRAPFELNIDRLSAEIIQHFSESGTIGSYPRNPTAKDTPDDRIRDLIMINILQIHEK